MPLELVVDANVLFSALLAKSFTRDLIFNPQLKLYSPEYLISELNEHLQSDEEIKEKLKQTGEETEKVIHELLHIPKTFGGGFRQHDYVYDRNVEIMYEKFASLKRSNSFRF